MHIRLALLSRNINIKIYGNKTFSVGSYGCETWSLTFRAERRHRVFVNRILGRIIRPKRDEVTG
jgi:hypothetical protein